MTICAGFTCSDGLLLCADTEISGGGKYDAVKVRRLPFALGEYVITGAGNLSFLGMASDMIENRLCDAEFELGADVQQQSAPFFDAVREVIVEIHREHIGSYPYAGEMPTFNLILGVDFNKGTPSLRLMHCATDGGVCWKNGDVFEGTGAAIARRFANILCRDQLPVDLMRTVAIFCLRQAKLGEVGCGGATHAYAFPPAGYHTLWDEDSVSEVTELAMRLCTVEARDMRLDREKFQEKVNDFLRKLMAVRNAVEQDIAMRSYVLEILRKGGLPSWEASSNAPEPPPEQSGGAVPGSDS